MTEGRFARIFGQTHLEPSPPQRPGNWLLGNLLEYRADPLAFFSRCAREQGDVVQLRFGSITAYFINHPDLIKRVLQDNHRNYTRHRYSNDLLKLTLDESILTMDGEGWLQRRRLMQPAFHRQRIAGFGQIMVEVAGAKLEHWQDRAGRDEPLDIAEEMMDLTLRVASRSFFSVDLNDEAGAIGWAVTEVSEYFNFVTGLPYPPPIWLPISWNRRQKAARARLDRIVYRMIADRRRTGEKKEDLLAMLMEARDEESGQGLEDHELRNEIMTMLLAGHETTSNALTWTFYLLAQHPAEAQRLREELARVLGGRAPTVEDLPQLRYTRMVVEEAMRLYPPAWSIARYTIAEDTLGGYRIPAERGVIMSAYTTHRHPDFWEEPERFLPERFAPERGAERPRFAYFPFGGGPHLCIGYAFALMEAQLVLATLAQRISLELVPGHPVVPHPLITLRPRNGLKMRVQPAPRVEVTKSDPLPEGQ